MNSLAQYRTLQLLARVVSLAFSLLLVTTLSVEPAHAQKYTFHIIHTFDDSDAGPNGGLTADGKGNLFGTVETNHQGSGALYKLDSKKVFSLVWDDTTDQFSPLATNVTMDPAGNMYATTWTLVNTAQQVLKITPNGTATSLYEFLSGKGECFPTCYTVRDGALWTKRGVYGSTMANAGLWVGTCFSQGGAPQCGAIYKLNSAQGSLKILHQFASFAGDGEGGSLTPVMDAKGNLYGTTVCGGKGNDGTLWEVTASGRYKIIYSFVTGSNCTGSALGPFGLYQLYMDKQGNIYGTTAKNPVFVWKWSTSTGKMKVLKTLYSATTWGGVIADAAGNLYGTLSGFRSNSAGIVYKIDTKGHMTTLYSFTGGADGASPWGNLYLDAAGNLWGTANLGGTSNKCTWNAGCGVLYELSPKK